MAIANKTKNFSTDMLLKTADIIIKKFVKNGSINYDDFEDTKQNVIEKYLNKKDIIENAFTGAAKPETYISAVIFRMVLEILRSEKNKPKRNSDLSDNSKIFNSEKVINPEEKLIIDNEKKYLERVLLTFGDERIKITLFCKFYFRLLILLVDIKGYIPDIFLKQVMKILDDNKNITDKEVFEKLCEVNNLIEQKKLKSDAIRMYVNKNIDKIIIRINGIRRAYYTKETLLILFEMLYEDKNENTVKIKRLQSS